MTAPTIPTLYHGTSVGWLMETGLKIQTRPFGEASPPHSFIYLSDKFSVAESAAWNATRHTVRRIQEGILSTSDFTHNGIFYPPAPYVYTLDLRHLECIDWQARHLPKKHLDAVVKVLQTKHYQTGKKLEFFAWLVKQKVLQPPWCEWAEYVATNYQQGLTPEDRIVAILCAAGFPLVQRIERMPDRTDSETWALSLNAAQTPIAVKELVPYRCV